MSTEVTPESLLALANWVDDKVQDPASANLALNLRALSDLLEREQQRPLPTEPGWYPTIVVERDGESCTGALLADDDGWRTTREVAGRYRHWLDSNPLTTIRWAEQDGKTRGKTFWEASLAEGRGHMMVSTSGVCVEDWRNESNAVWHPSCERIAAAVLAAHGTPTLTEWKCSSCGDTTRARMADHDATLTPVGEHPEPGTRGLLPVVVSSSGDMWLTDYAVCICGVGPRMVHAILADPRPGGAHE